MVHEINLKNYTASCGAADNVLQLGTAGSYGIERLHITADSAWDGLALTASFSNAGRTTTVSVIDNMVDVPPEATQDATRDRVRYGVVVIAGCDADGTVRRISTSLLYVVLPHGIIDGKNTITPTPDQYAQFVAAVKADADRAVNAAETTAETLTAEVNAATEAANTAAQEANMAAESASNAASAANNAASAATTAKTEANNAAYAANTAAGAANTAKTDADSAAAAANTAAELANAAKNAADNAASAANTAASGAATAATAANNATQQAQSATTNAQAAAAACQNIAAGINSMADDATGKTYTIGVHAGMVYLQEV